MLGERWFIVDLETGDNGTPGEEEISREPGRQDVTGEGRGEGRKPPIRRWIEWKVGAREWEDEERGEHEKLILRNIALESFAG